MSVFVSYSVRCDRCDTSLTELDGSPAFYETVEAAHAAGATEGWTVQPSNDRRDVAECPACTPPGAPRGA